MKESDEFLILQKYFKDLGSQYLMTPQAFSVGPGDDAGLFLQKTRSNFFHRRLKL